jgi:hypothetical protein
MLRALFFPVSVFVFPVSVFVSRYPSLFPGSVFEAALVQADRAQHRIDLSRPRD